MKRSPLRRKTPLTSKTRPRPPRRWRKDSIVEHTPEDRLAFRRAIIGETCVVCGLTEGEAFRLTGHGHQAHHAISQQRLRRRGLEVHLWDPANAVCACEEPCHRRHTTRHRTIRRSELPYRVFDFATRLGLKEALWREYPDP